ncbi:putative E3 ubiquitin-protein ligase RHA4A [Silene latifolia]|uniref:putative E3 ubiquitin-protein ligase RHA4A n=1 Tax=Silene latifolia TaxID=37657 RepID=UPI003D76A6D0
MERHEESTTDHLNPNVYPEELQLKLYQAFIFSIPILFSIILFLLFYLFYLKRRATNNISSQNPRISPSTNPSLFISPPWSVGIKGELKDKLQVVQFDEELKARESLCCVCLGEFEMKEELRQLTLCKHVFHGDCIRHWLRANATCPLCRCPLISSSAIKMGHSIGAIGLVQVNSNPTDQQEGDSSRSVSEEHVIQIPDDPPSNVSTSSS